MANYLALVFARAGMISVYAVALFISYLFGISSFLIWKSIKIESRAMLLPKILGAGLILFLAPLIILLTSD